MKPPAGDPHIERRSLFTPFGPTQKLRAQSIKILFNAEFYPKYALQHLQTFEQRAGRKKLRGLRNVWRGPVVRGLASVSAGLIG